MANTDQCEGRACLSRTGLLLPALYHWHLNLTRRGVDLVWYDMCGTCEGALRTMKAALIISPILAYPTRVGHFVLSTDDSDVGIGALLEHLPRMTLTFQRQSKSNVIVSLDSPYMLSY